MKPHHKTPQNLTRAPKPLSIEQQNAIALLIVGHTDQETADAVGVSRETVWSWRREHLVFQSELEQARGNLWRHAAERLRGLMDAAIANIAKAIEGEDVKASFELLKAVGIYGDAEINRIADWRLDAMIKTRAEAQTEQEGLVKDTMRALIDVSDNPAYRNRVAQIEDDLWAQYGDTSNGTGSE